VGGGYGEPRREVNLVGWDCSRLRTRGIGPVAEIRGKYLRERGERTRAQGGGPSVVMALNFFPCTGGGGTTWPEGRGGCSLSEKKFFQKGGRGVFIKKRGGGGEKNFASRGRQCTARNSDWRGEDRSATLLLTGTGASKIKPGGSKGLGRDRGALKGPLWARWWSRNFSGEGLRREGERGSTRSKSSTAQRGGLQEKITGYWMGGESSWARKTERSGGGGSTASVFTTTLRWPIKPQMIL